MRFYGFVGFGTQIETAAGVWDDVIEEKAYFGDVVRNLRQLEPSEGVNDNLGISHSISIVADAFASENFLAIRYVSWAGVRWKVTNVEIQRPRLIMQVGGVYNGPTPAP